MRCCDHVVDLQVCTFSRACAEEVTLNFNFLSLRKLQDSKTSRHSRDAFLVCIIFVIMSTIHTMKSLATHNCLLNIIFHVAE